MGSLRRRGDWLDWFHCACAMTVGSAACICTHVDQSGSLRVRCLRLVSAMIRLGPTAAIPVKDVDDQRFALPCGEPKIVSSFCNTLAVPDTCFVYITGMHCKCVLCALFILLYP